MTNPFADTTYGQLSVMCDRLFTLLDNNKAALGLADLFYGDQSKIPRTPTLCLEPDIKQRTLAGVPRRSENTLRAYLLIYVSKVQDVQSNSRDVLVFAETVEALLHVEPTLGGLLVHSFCPAIEPGYRTRDNTQFRACRITFEGINKSILGM